MAVPLFVLEYWTKLQCIVHTDGVVDDDSSSNFELLHPVYWVPVLDYCWYFPESPRVVVLLFYLSYTCGTKVTLLPVTGTEAHKSGGELGVLSTVLLYNCT